MSILIRGMKMPEAAEDCTFYEVAPLRPYPHCRVRPGESCGFPDDCPLIEVQTPHGRLIDADKIPYKKIMLDDDDEFYYGVTQPYIDRMPTIIPASDKDTDVPIKEEGE